MLQVVVASPVEFDQSGVQYTICRTLRYVGFAPLSASLAAAMPPAARPDCAMQPVRSVLRVAHINFAKTTPLGAFDVRLLHPLLHAGLLRRTPPPYDAYLSG